MMPRLVPTRGVLRPRANRSTAFAAALLLGSTLPVLMTFGASPAAAQVSSTRSVCFTVTDPQGRFVTGLERQHFAVSENGVRREVNNVAGAYSPSTIVIVSEDPLPEIASLGPADELIQTTSLTDALQQLAASPSPRKGIVAVAATAIQAIPSGIPTLQTDRAGVAKAVMALRQQYCLDVEPSNPSASVEVVLHEIRGLPALNVNWLNW